MGAIETERTSELREYLFAARRRIAVALWHRGRLLELIDDPDADEVGLQASFEGVMGAGVAAAELAAEGFARFIGEPAIRFGTRSLP